MGVGCIDVATGDRCSLRLWVGSGARIKARNDHSV